MKTKILIIYYLIFSLSLFGFQGSGGTGDAIFTLPMGSEAEALGGYMILPKDASVMNYNPAGNAAKKNIMLLVNYSPNIMPDTGYLSAGMSFYTKILTAGVIYRQVFINGINYRNSFSYSEENGNNVIINPSIVLSREIFRGISVGLKVNFIAEKNNSAWSIKTPGGDVYISYVSPNPFESMVKSKVLKVLDNFVAYFGVKNLVPSFTVSDGFTRSDFIFTGALGYRILLPGKAGNLYFQMGSTWNKNLLGLGIGAEYNFLEHFKVLGGYNIITKRISIGTGVEFKGFGIDYTFTPDLTGMGMSHYISITMNLGFMYK